MNGRLTTQAVLAFCALGCGVAGRPMPPGALPPSPPNPIRQISTPEGIEIHGPARYRDIDGVVIPEPVELRLFGSDSPLTGRPLAKAKNAPIQMPPSTGSRSVRLVAYRGRRASQPSPAFTLSWTPPPTAPSPIGFIDDAGRTRLMWPTVEEDVHTITVLRDGTPITELDSKSTSFSESAPGTRHQYQLVTRGETFCSAPSAGVMLTRSPTP